MKTRGWKIWPCPWVINKIWQNGHIHFDRFEGEFSAYAFQ